MVRFTGIRCDLSALAVRPAACISVPGSRRQEPADRHGRAPNEEPEVPPQLGRARADEGYLRDVVAGDALRHVEHTLTKWQSPTRSFTNHRKMGSLVALHTKAIPVRVQTWVGECSYEGGPGRSGRPRTSRQQRVTQGIRSTT